jgi:hypothetical protein
MTHGAGETVRQTIKGVLAMLLDRVTTEGTPARVSLCVGRDANVVVLAEAARGGPAMAETMESTDWPLEASGEPVGLLRFAVASGVPEDAGAAALREITATLERDEPRVTCLVTGLAHLAVLADYFRHADEARNRAA